jgi:hypothetical protein
MKTETDYPLHKMHRREIATAAMQGLLADPANHSADLLPNETCHDGVARKAVMHADALIAALNKKTP